MTVTLGKCLYCERPLEQSLKGRDKKFCNDKCRQDYREEEASIELGR